MGVLTDDMTRLRREIQILRSNRKAFLTNMESNVSRMLHNFHDANARTAKKTKADLSSFVYGLKQKVTTIRDDANNMRRKFIADITGAHRAWFGPVAAIPQFKAPFVSQHVEAERKTPEHKQEFIPPKKK